MLSHREKQNRANSSRQQHNSGAPVRHARDMFVSTFICIVIAPSVFVIIALVPSSAIVVGIREHWENHASGY
jgi:hypothetical protein